MTIRRLNKQMRIKETSMKKIIISISFLFIFIGCNSIEKKETRPNIIYILADDLGYGELGVYGQEKILTPNIDKLQRTE